MKKHIHYIKTRLLLLTVTGLAIVFLIGGAIFVFTPLQRYVLRIVMLYYGIPFYVNYSDAKLVPGNLLFINLQLIYQSESQTLCANIDTLEVKYKMGKPIILHELRIINPKVTLTGEAKATAADTTARIIPRLPEITIEKMTVLSGSIDMPDLKMSEFSFLGSLEIKADYKTSAIDAHIDSMGVLWHDCGHIGSLKGNLSVLNNLLSFDGRIVLDSTKGAISIARMNPFSGTFEEIHFVGDTVSYTEVDTLLDIDVLEGKGSVDIAVRHIKEESYELGFDIDGVLWDIPMKGKDISLKFNDKKQLVTIDINNTKVWNASVRNARIEIYAEYEPIKYHFEINDAQNFDLNVFDVMSSKLNGNATIDGVDFGDSMQMKIFATLKQSELDDYKFDSASVNLTFDTAGVHFPEGLSQVAIENSNANFWGDISPDGKVDLYFTANILDPEYVFKRFDMDFPLKGAFEANARVAGDSEKIAVRFGASGKNASLFGTLFDSVEANGQFNDFENLSGNLAITALNGTLNSTKIETLNITLTTAQNKLFFRPLIAKLDIGSLRSTGVLSLGDTTILKIEGLSFDATGANITLAKPINVVLQNGISTGLLSFDAFGGNITLDTFAMLDSLIVARGAFEQISLKMVSSFLTDLELGGSASGRFAMSIDTSTMIGTGAFNVLTSPFIIDGFSWNTLSIEGKLMADTLVVSMCHLQRQGENADITGEIYLGADKPKANFKLAARGDDLLTFTNLFKIVEPNYGGYELLINATGPLDSPTLSGNFKIEDASINISPLDNPLENIYMKASIQNNVLAIEKLEGTIKSKPLGGTNLFERLKTLITGEKLVEGKVSAQGTVDLSQITSPNFNLTAQIKNLPIKSTSDGYFFIINDSLKLTGTSPKLSGELIISEGNLLRIGSATPEPAKSPIPIDISVTTENLWLLTNEMEAKIAGELFITNSEDNISLLGELNIENGKYFVYGQNFDVESGLLRFGKISEIDPDMDVIAKTIIGNEDMILHITGKLSAPQLEISSSNPDFTSDDLSRLILGSDSTGVRNALEERTQDLLQKYLEHQISHVAQTTLGLDEIELEPTDTTGNLLNPSAMRLTVGKRVAGNLYVRYSQALSGDPRQQVELQYKISRHLSVGALEDADRNYRLKLDLHWDY